MTNLFNRHFLVASASVLLVTGCSDSTTEPEVEQVVTHTVDASGTTMSFVSIGSTVTPATVADPATSTAWDLGFLTTTVRVNGGAGGPAGVKAYCVCQNDIAAMTYAQIGALTPESELADFNAVTAANIPSSAAAWEAGADNIQGAFGPAANRFYKYWGTTVTPNDHTIYPSYQVYLIKRGNDVYKLQLIGYYNAAGAPRHITFRYAKL